MTTANVTAATRTPEGARLDLDTGETLTVTPDTWAALSSTPPYALVLGEPPAARVLGVPAALLAQVAQALDIPSRAPHALPVLLAAQVRAGHITLTTREPGAPFTRAVTYPQPLAFTLSGAGAVNMREPLTLTTWAGEPHRSPQLARYQVEPYTVEGQAALVALGFAGPYPVPEGVALGGYSHGTALTEHEALTLAALPDFVDLWVICPSESGGAPFTLLWGDAATTEQLSRSSDWAELTAASLRAEGAPRGSA